MNEYDYIYKYIRYRLYKCIKYLNNKIMKYVLPGQESVED